MNKYLKYGLIAATGVVALFFTAAAVISLSFDPNSYKPQLVKLVQDKKQRTLSVPGNIKLTFFPKLGVDMGPVSISEYQSGGEFAAVESARLYLSWWPLLRKELVVDQVRVSGLRAKLTRFKDGSTNFDDLLGKDDEPQQFKFDIDSVKLGASEIALRDEMGGQRFVAGGLELETGRLSDGKPSHFKAAFRLEQHSMDKKPDDKPRLAAQIRLASGLVFDSKSGEFALKGANLEVNGEAAGWHDLALGVKGDVALKGQEFTLENLALALAGKQGAEEADVRLTTPKIEFGPEHVSAQKILLVAKMQPVSATPESGGKQGKASGDGSSMVLTIPSLTGTRKSFKAEMSVEARSGTVVANLDGPLAGDLEVSKLEWPGLRIGLLVRNPKAPNGVIKSELSGTLLLDLKKQSASLNAGGRLDESKLKLKLAAAPLSSPHYSFDLDIDRIDGDRYLAAAGSSPAKQQPGKGMDFAAPRSLKADGVLHVGQLTLFGAKASNLRLEIKAKDGALSVSPFSMVEQAVKDRAKKEIKNRLGEELKSLLPGLSR